MYLSAQCPGVNLTLTAERQGNAMLFVPFVPTPQVQLIFSSLYLQICHA